MTLKLRYANILRTIQLIWLSFLFHLEALKQSLHTEGPFCLLHPKRISDNARAKLFTKTSPGFIAYEDTTVVPSLVQSARGKVLELGPGSGNQIHRFNSAAVDVIYGIDPNPCFADVIAAKVKKNDLDGKYKLLVCGLEDREVLQAEGITESSVDTVLSIQVLCSVDDAKVVMGEVYRLLKPGGSFIFWEHGRSMDAFTATAQYILDPAWSTFIGCGLRRDILATILAAGDWENPGDIQIGNEPYSCLPRIWGELKKRKT